MIPPFFLPFHRRVFRLYGMITRRFLKLFAKGKRKFLTQPCPHCKHEVVNPHTLFHLPDELDALATALALPPETVTQKIATGEIRTRISVDDNGRPHGAHLVLFRDAVKAVLACDQNN